jgi:ribosome-binding factor A
MTRARSRSHSTPRHYPRVARVNEVVLEALAQELEELSDPRLGFVTLTGVEVSKDLQVADVYYSVLGEPEQRAGTAAALVSATPRLRTVLGHNVRMKYVPELRFREDPSVAGGQRIETLLRELHPEADPADDRAHRRRNEGDR